MLLTFTVLSLTAGVAAMAVGLRGRRTDDHVRCRRCGYDLTGHADAAVRCPECGTDLSGPLAMCVGRWGSRRRPVVAGLALMTLAAAVQSIRAAGWDDPARQPLWWLRLAAHGPAALRRSAVVGLRRPLADGRLSPAEIARLVDRGLAAQAGPEPWDHSWGAFIEAAHDAGQLDAARWQTYLCHGYQPALRVRPIVRPGDPLPLAITWTDRVFQSRLLARYTVGGMSIDGRPVPSGDWIGWSSDAFLLPGSVKGSMIDGRFTRGLPPGHHQVAVRLHANLYFGGNPLPSPLPGSRVGMLIPPLAQPGDVVVDLPLTATFNVVDAAHEPAVTLADPAQRAAVTRSLDGVSVRVDPDGTASLSNAPVPQPPVRMVFRATLRIGGGVEQAIGGVNEVYPDPFNSPSHFGVPLYQKTITGVRWRVDVDRVDVTFYPDPDAARSTVDPTPIWGEPVVVHDVPVWRR